MLFFFLSPKRLITYPVPEMAGFDAIWYVLCSTLGGESQQGYLCLKLLFTVRKVEERERIPGRDSYGESGGEEATGFEQLSSTFSEDRHCLDLIVLCSVPEISSLGCLSQKIKIV